MNELFIKVSVSDRNVEFLYQYAGKSFSHNLLVPKKFLNDCLFNHSLAKIAILSRPINSKKIVIEGDLFLDQFSLVALEKTTGADIECRVMQNSVICSYDKSPDKLIIAFSGGFDSVCALALLEDEATLFSVDYLGWFKRERKFFEKFNTDIFEWDIRQRKFDGESYNESLDYRFLISPAVFYASEKFSGLVTGTVLEASEYQYTPIRKNPFVKYNPEVFGFGISPVPLISSLSEFCTAKVANIFLGEDGIRESLDSLAFESSFKTYRKKCLIAAAFGREMPNKPPSLPKHVFGNYLADDIIALYFIWKYGYDCAVNNYCEDVGIEYVLGLDMSFFERSNTNNLMGVDPILREIFLNNLMGFDIRPYTDFDLELLSKSIYVRRKIMEAKK